MRCWHLDHPASKRRQGGRTRPARTAHRCWAQQPPAGTTCPTGKACNRSNLRTSGSCPLGIARASPARAAGILSPWGMGCTSPATLRPPRGYSCPLGMDVQRSSLQGRSYPWGMSPRSAPPVGAKPRHHARCCSPHIQPSSCGACRRRGRDLDGRRGGHPHSWPGSQPASCPRSCMGRAAAPLSSQTPRTCAAAHRARKYRVALAARTVPDPRHRVRWRSQSWPGREEPQWQRPAATKNRRPHRPQPVGHHPVLELLVSYPWVARVL